VSGGVQHGAVAPSEPITASRVTELLQGAGHDVVVETITIEAVGTGQMGASYRIGLGIAGDRGELPGTLVAKIAAGPTDKREMAAGSYRTEVDFYRNIASTVAVRVPRCWASWTNDDCTDFVLLLEDLAPRRQGDQILGCSAEQARAAAVNVAGLHGPRWCDPTLVGPGGLNVLDPDGAAMLGEVMTPMNEMFFDYFGDRLAVEHRAVFERVPAVAGAWLLGRPERHGPVHGDYRLDNLMFAPDGSDVAAVDWQTISFGLPARDLAFLCSTGLEPELRRSCEESVLAAYHEALLTYGVEGYSLEECRDDYAYAMLQGLLIVVFGWAVADKTPRGDAMFLAMAERTCAAIDDHDPFARL